MASSSAMLSMLEVKGTATASVVTVSAGARRVVRLRWKSRKLEVVCRKLCQLIQSDEGTGEVAANVQQPCCRHWTHCELLLSLALAAGNTCRRLRWGIQDSRLGGLGGSFGDTGGAIRYGAPRRRDPSVTS
ncbi:hypothetical protein CCUS01_08779 [Colletotrichum cuscutae]|uniref:Uncharacterized protein n=1 Tax=Colletotrichum cuscutae TaxID=1209917 RepID=A0AAI9ULI7_9PEZI|nr:hypothetical protein CCUS01_08779 [Colletotrichum cuscutae]